MSVSAPTINEATVRQWIRSEVGNLPELVRQLQGASAGDVLHLVGASGEPAFENSWTNFGAPERVAAFYRANGRVFLQGMIRGGALNTTMFTLPAGFRPVDATSAGDPFLVNASDGAGSLRVFPDGRVTLAAGTLTFVSLYGVDFRVA